MKRSAKIGIVNIHSLQLETLNVREEKQHCLCSLIFSVTGRQNDHCGPRFEILKPPPEPVPLSGDAVVVKGDIWVCCSKANRQ